MCEEAAALSENEEVRDFEIAGSILQERLRDLCPDFVAGSSEVIVQHLLVDQRLKIFQDFLGFLGCCLFIAGFLL